MNVSLFSKLTMACAAALTLFAGSLRADDPACSILPEVQLPTELQNLVDEGSGTIWVVDRDYNRELLGYWDCTPCYQTMTIWLEADDCMITIDLSQEIEMGCASGTFAYFDWIKTDPSLSDDPNFTTLLVDEGHAAFRRYDFCVDASVCGVETCFPVATEIEGHLTNDEFEYTEVVFVGAEPPSCLE